MEICMNKKELEETAMRDSLDYVDSIPDGGTDKHPWNDHDVEKAYYDGMLAGAKWMAGQGESFVSKVMVNSMNDSHVDGYYLDEKIPEGTDVIVQIRRKI